MSAWFRAGTVAVTSGSTAVAGTGTGWQVTSGSPAVTTNVVNPGDVFTVDNVTLYEIVNVGSATSITLDRPFAGSTASGAAYAIISQQQLPSATVGNLATLATTLAALQTKLADLHGTNALQFGSGAPTSAGATGQLYADTNSGRLYAQPASGSWLNVSSGGPAYAGEQRFPVTQYGCTGVPGVDQIAGIRAAYAAAKAAGGGIVVIPTGTFDMIGGTLVVNDPNITIEGEGWGSILRVPYQSGSRLYPFAMIAVTPAAVGFRARGLTLQGANTLADSNATNATSLISRGIYIGSNVAGTGPYYTGAYGSRAPFYSGAVIEDCYFAYDPGNQVGLAAAIQLDWQKSVTIRGNRVESMVGRNSGFGYGALVSGVDTMVEGNRFVVAATGDGSSGRHGVYPGDKAQHVKVIGNYFQNFRDEAFSSNLTEQGLDLVLSDNHFVDCSDASEYSIDGVVYLGGWTGATVTDNFFETTDTSTWGRVDGITSAPDQDGNFENYDLLIKNNRLKGFQGCGVRLENTHRAQVQGNIFEDVGLNGAGSAVLFKLSDTIRVEENLTVINPGTVALNGSGQVQGLYANVYLDTTTDGSHAIPSNCVVRGNQVILNPDNTGGSNPATLFQEFGNPDQGADNLFSTALAGASGRKIFWPATGSDPAVPNLAGGVTAINHAPSGYCTITGFANPLPNQRFVVRAYTNFTKIQNNATIQLATGNDMILRANTEIEFFYDADAGRFYEVARGKEYEYGQAPPVGRWLQGDRSWNIAQDGGDNNWGGWTCTVPGFAMQDSDVWSAGKSIPYAGYLVWYGANVYSVGAAGNLGSTPPTHTSGTVSDGSLSLTYLDARAQFARFAKLEPTVLVTDGTTNSAGCKVSTSVVILNTTAGVREIYLPYAKDCPGQSITMVRITGTSEWVVGCSGTDQVQGASTLVVNPTPAVAGITLVSDGVGSWWAPALPG